MYLKLINSNVKKTLQDYQIYIITLVVSSALFFSFISLSSPCNTIIADGTKYSDAMFRQTINLTVGLVSLIFFVLVNYVNNHMIKRRAKEFSIYMLLGMEQKKIAFLYFVETLEVGLLAILIGTIAGTLLSGALTSIVILATGGDFDYKLGFYPDTFFKTMLFFIFVFILVGVFNTTKLSKTKLINLLNADKTVEGHLQNKKKYFISLIVTIISFASAVIMIKDYLSTGRGYMSNIPSVVSNKYQLIIGILLVCGIFSGYYAVSYIIYVVKERSKHYKYKKLNGVFISNLYARSASNAKVIASATIAIAVSILGFVVAPVLADISEEFLKFRMPYDLMINNSYRYIDKKSDIPHIDFSFVNRILNEHGIKESEICQQEGYFVWASNFENMETRDNKWDMPRLAVSLSDYNQMRKMAGLSPIELGILFSMIVYVQQLYSPAVALGETYNSIKNAQPSILRISTLLENKEMVEEADFCPEGSLKGNIIFKNVTFSYAQNTDPVFRNLNLSLKAGRIYGITGDNGMGKSTFIRLIAGLCMPDSGNIYIDDIEIKKYNVEYLRKHIGYLLQKPLLLRGKNPIDNIDTKRMMRYFNMGKKRYLEENVKGLSGGESQKLALAYLLSDKTKDIYILDEPTASVDLKSEEVICSQIRDALKGKTALIITHRRSILKICDEVIDFNKEVSYKNVRKM